MKKLITPLIQSQRDNRWASVILGNNNQTQFNIGNYGCLITSLANYLGKTPVDINNVKALFTQGGGDFIWSQTSLIGLNNVYTSPRYEDEVTTQGINKMKSLIDEGRPLICEIDFNPTTTKEDQHYVLIHGYDENLPDTFIGIDPWTGTVIDLSVYGGVKRTLYCFRAYDKTLPIFSDATSGADCPAQLKKATEDLESITKERNHLNDVIGMDKDPLIERWKKIATMLKIPVDNMDKAPELCVTQIEDLQKTVSSFPMQLEGKLAEASTKCQTELSIQKSDLITEQSNKELQMKKDFEAELTEAKQKQKVVYKYKETPLSDLYKGKSLKVKLAAVAKIIQA